MEQVVASPTNRFRAILDIVKKGKQESPDKKESKKFLCSKYKLIHSRPDSLSEDYIQIESSDKKVFTR
jgi:hypothetical protein